MRSKFTVVFLKELRDHMRDRRSLVLLAVFVLMFPIMIGYMLNHQISKATKAERQGMQLAVIGGAQAPTLMSELKQKNITIVNVEDMDEEAIGKLLRKRKAVALLRLKDNYAASYHEMRPADIELWYDSAGDDRARQRDIEDVINAYSAGIASARLLAHGVSPATLAPVRLQRYDTGSNAARSATVIGALMGMLFLPAFTCCLSAAVDSTAGERERRSLEVLMAQPVSPWTLMGGKWMAAAVLGFIGLSCGLLLMHLILAWLPLEEIGMSWRVTSFDLARVCLASIPLCLFAAALQIAVAMNSKTYKEAQSILSIVALLPLVPGAAVSMLQIQPAWWMYLVPMLSNQNLMRELAKGGDVSALLFALTAVCALLPALAIMAFASWRMRSERYVLAV